MFSTHKPLHIYDDIYNHKNHQIHVALKSEQVQEPVNLLCKPTLLMMMIMVMMIMAMDMVRILIHHLREHNLVAVNLRQPFLDLVIADVGIVFQDHVVAVRDLAAVTMTETACRQRKL